MSTGSMTASAHKLSILLLAFALSGCGEGDDSADDGSTANAAGEACPVGQVRCGGCIDTIAPTATVLHERVFARSCALSSCHNGAAPAEGLALGSVDDLIANAVAKPSKQVPTRSLIEPGKPADSYLIHKLRNTGLAARASDGTPATVMPPPPNEVLCEAKIQEVEAWIAAGATR